MHLSLSRLQEFASNLEQTAGSYGVSLGLAALLPRSKYDWVVFSHGEITPDLIIYLQRIGKLRLLDCSFVSLLSLHRSIIPTISIPKD